MKQARTAGTVLVVDADAELRRAICTIFARVGVRTREAETGAEALRAVAQESPLLALLDVCLEDISGYEVCHEIKQTTGKRVPVILMSAQRTDPLDRVAGLLIGADDYLAKPFDLDELLIRTRKLIERSLPSESPIMATLTPREREILCLLADGLEQRDISDALLISPKTVGTHIEHILGKLGARSRAQAIAIAYQDGLMESRMRQTGLGQASRNLRVLSLASADDPGPRVARDARG
jgi:DNA-binding NarL/FixJ family response regulator